jgi:uncharacterized protein (TIGR03084 family)
VTHANVFSALATDSADVDRLVADLDPGEWSTPTPAPGWTIKHQVAHLSAVFRMAAMAAAEPDRFKALAEQLSGDFDGNVEAALARYLDADPALVLSRWRVEWTSAVGALALVPAGQPVPWLVRPLPAPVLAAAGMMELFGHGQDIADALGVRRRHTDRLRHVVEFAVHTWDFGYLARGLTAPAEPFRYELVAPSGGRWSYGPEGAQTIAGPAVDFCLLVTRRRHRADLALTASGPAAEHWLDIAQAYRGPAGPGRQPGQFSSSTATPVDPAG